jgi:hypothetical protein
MFTLTLTPTGTVDRKVTEHGTRAEAEAALAAFAGTAYRITEHTLTTQTGRVAQASYTHVIREI